nr:methylated-DNA--[protein]-cysteine S-methyltransferase [Prosthecobacter sp.]
MSENGQQQSPERAMIWPNTNRTDMTPSSYFYKTMPSPVGLLTLVANDHGLAAVLWENDDPKRVRLSPLHEDRKHPVLLDAERQLQDYFAGKRETFSLKLDFIGGTEFQQKVWAALLTIPFGETRSYAQIAEQIGNPNAVRAVGAANGKNPISIIAPCHRVIGSNGKLTGFAGGMDAKAFLLKLETKDFVLQ